jgi:broad specificity phosphatase PhoE
MRGKKYKLIWIESICTLASIIESNIFKTKINSPDYKNWNDPDKAAEDFRNRIREYEKIYEKVSIENDSENAAFIQIINQGEKMIIRNVKGYMESKIISYLTNLHTGDRPIFFLRHGESEANKLGIIGGDSSLSQLGEKYSDIIAKFFERESAHFTQKPVIFTSTLRRSIQTADKLMFLNNYKAEKKLDELKSGLRDGITYEEFKEKYPDEEKERSLNKLNYRYPRGESYMDVIQRIEPIIFEIERIRAPVIIVGHQGMLRCLYGYFAGVPIEMIPTLEIPMHTVIKFVPDAYGFYEVRYKVDAESGYILEDDKSFVKFYDDLLHVPE